MENKIRPWMRENLRKDCVIIEAGTYDGKHSAAFANDFPNSKIYGFEPIDELYNRTINLTKRFHNISIEKKALGSSNRKSDINISKLNGNTWASSSLLEPKEHLTVHTNISFSEKEQVEVIVLDDWCSENNVSKVDFIWLDTQGSEWDIINSSPNIVSKTKYIYCEVSLKQMYKGTPLIEDFKNKMAGLNFEVVFEDLPWEDMGDILFKNKNIDNLF